MAIRKPRPTGESKAASVSAAGGWPYAIQERRLRVQSDGTLRIPATFARLFALEGEEVGITLFADGHVEINGPYGRASEPSSSEPGARTYNTPREFLAALDNDVRDQ